MRPSPGNKTRRHPRWQTWKCLATSCTRTLGRCVFHLLSLFSEVLRLTYADPVISSRYHGHRPLSPFPHIPSQIVKVGFSASLEQIVGSNEGTYMLWRNRPLKGIKVRISTSTTRNTYGQYFSGCWQSTNISPQEVDLFTSASHSATPCSMSNPNSHTKSPHCRFDRPSCNSKTATIGA